MFSSGTKSGLETSRVAGTMLIPTRFVWPYGRTNLSRGAAFGRVYMGMNLDSTELITVKQVLSATNSASKEKAQAHVRELEDEVKLLKNFSHSNIVMTHEYDLLVF
ncbi:hypothetical protein HHK36_025623 [Tetracentron sinense]|uniref:Protein kinase domain-containing protein n=1 Tax=Tetracentron sinense TaxID=13715 RepID=A0A834YJ25_TETSI|nr:hypothetical protein HHK36_025623 [Tetracentron sinense]